MKDNTCSGFGQPPAEKPTSQRQKQHDATKAKVLAAARVHFETRGYEATTIRSLAAEIGMSTGAVFASFKDKEALYVAVYQHPPISPEVGRELLEAALALRSLIADIAPEYSESTVVANAGVAIAKASA